MAELARALAFQLRHQPDGERARRTSMRRCSWRGASWSCRSRTSSSVSRAPRSSAASRSAVQPDDVLATCSSATTTSASTPRRKTNPETRWRGFDIRWNSPIGNWPYAIYAQMIGEDESGYMPAKYPGAVRRSKCGSHWRAAASCRDSSNTPPPPVRRIPAAVLITTAPTTRAVQRRRLSIPRPRHRPHRRQRLARSSRSAPPTPTPGGELWTATSRARRDSIATARRRICATP